MQNCVLFFSSLNSRKTDNELALCIIHRLLIVLYYEDATAKKKSDDTDGICNNEKENDEEGDDLPSPTSMPNATKSQSKKAELKKSITTATLFLVYTLWCCKSIFNLRLLVPTSLCLLQT